MKIMKDLTYGFATGFNPETGLTVRSNLYNRQGRDTGQAPFMAQFPHLLDIGIMGHCAHGQSGLCLASGVSCYQDGQGVVQPHMSLEIFRGILEQCQGKVFQVALGGRGDPDQHPDFREILTSCREYDVVPNFTTSGFRLTGKDLDLIRETCGAVAVSWYRSKYTLRAISLVLNAGIRTNIHYVLSNRTIEEALERMEGNHWPEGINRIIFLLHKPVGLGQADDVLHFEDERVQRFFGLFSRQEHCDRAGFDSCSVPGLLNLARGIAPQSLETCEGGRFSAYITPDNRMLPCSFDQNNRYGVDLEDTTIQEAWGSARFDSFRERLRTRCPGCRTRALCMGGCPLEEDIVLCSDRDRQPQDKEMIAV